MPARAPRVADPESVDTAGTRGPPPGLRLTASGGVLLILVATILGGFLDGLFGVAGYGLLTGPLFGAGCVFAAVKTRGRDRITLMVTPPSLFVVAVVLVETARSWGSGNWFRNEVVAVTMALAGEAFWIAAGTVAAILIAAVRGVLTRHASS